MRITRYTDYSLRVLIYLGIKGEALATIQEIADRYGISKNHLMKVVHDLQLKGYVETLRGKHGGLRLRRAPAEISVGELVRSTEPDMTLVECFSEANDCVIAPDCRLKHVLGEALQGFLGVLDRYTLADLIPSAQRPGLSRALALGPAEVTIPADGLPARRR